MRTGVLWTAGLTVLNVALALLLAPLYEGLMRKLKAAIHSRIGPPVTQPYLDLFKLLGKEDLRTAGGVLYGAAPALTLGSVLLLALLVPMGARPPFAFAGDIVVLLYVAAISAVLLMLTAFGSGSPYASVGSSREMMMMLSVEPVMVVALVVGALKAGTLATGDIIVWQLEHGPTISMAIAGIAFFLALQAQAGKLPFDIPEADQEIMGGPLIEQSGPRLALFRWAMWSKQFVLAVLLVEVFLPWPGTGVFALDLLLTLVKAFVVLVVVALVDAVNPRLRIDQAMGYYLRVAFSSIAALAFAVIGM
ncbi:MAG: NADH-quinone oxidoreductase subunit H [Thermoanaerobaculaceae bacterium]|jgi:formate hydrogenlyase subunit 4|nr:NADH-quinone oxidoreductase subunit H [Thermoanaerobaculaceae bacterium]